MKDLKKHAVSGVKWTALTTALSAAIGPIVLTVKARFLSPEEFGYLSIIFIVIGFSRLLEGFGISQAIIQKDTISKKECSSLFVFNIFLSVLWAAALILLAPSIAVFFDLPKLNIFLPAVSAIILIQGPSLLFRAFLQKYLYFKALSLIAIIQQILSLILVVLFLVRGYGLMGVIYSNILGALFATTGVLAFALNKKAVTITFYFHPNKLVPYLRFGVFVTGKQLMTFVMHRFDEILIGYFLTSEVLGIYHFGKHLLEKILSLMTNSFTKVLFPVLSQIKSNKQRLTKVYHQISHYIAFLAFPIFTGIATTAHIFVPVIFGEQWVESVIVFQVFSLALIFLALTANVSTSLLYSVNKPGLVFYIDVITNALYVASLLLFVRYGMVAVLLVYSSYVVYKTTTLQYFASKNLSERFLTYVKQLSGPALFAMIMTVTVLLFQTITVKLLDQTLLLIFSIALGAITYGFLSLVLAKNTIRGIKELLK